MGIRMASCSQAEDYVAGKLSAADARAFESHAASCGNCGKALVRRKAVERAASVMKRNQAARGSRPDIPSAANPQIAPAPVHPPTTAPELTSAPTREWSREPTVAPSPNGKRVAIAIAAALTVGVGLWAWATTGNSQPEPDALALTAPPSEPTPEPALTALPPPVAAQPEQQLEAPAKTPPLPAEVPPSAPTVAQPVAEAPAPSPAQPVAEVAAKPATPPKTDGKAQDWLPIGTDIEELASTVASKKCGAAVTALRDRVMKNKADARSWALLTTCYAKRKRWQSALDAYDMVVQYGDEALVASVQSHADAARAGLEAEQAEAATAVPAPQP